MEIKVFDRLTSIDAGEWDDIVAPADIFHSYRFLSALEESGVENAAFQYLLFYDNGLLAASAVLSVFVIQLDLLVPQHPAGNAVKRIFPDFFKLKICFCGTPVSIGQRNLVTRSTAYLPHIVPLLTGQMQKFAKENSAKALILKEFFEPDADALEPLLAQQGFFKGYSLPYLKLPLRWQSFDAYLDDMRSPFRRQVLSSMKKIADQKDITLAVLDDKTCPPEVFYDLYMRVMGRAAVKLETLNESFFRQFFEKMPENKRVLGLMRGSELLGAVLLVEHGRELTFVWAGKPQARDDAHDNYFNLMTGMVDYAIRSGFGVLNFGQVAFYTKQRLGGEPHQLHIFFRSESRFWHRVVKLFRKAIFPKVALPVYRVFKGR